MCQACDMWNVLCTSERSIGRTTRRITGGSEVSPRWKTHGRCGWEKTVKKLEMFFSLVINSFLITHLRWLSGSSRAHWIVGRGGGSFAKPTRLTYRRWTWLATRKKNDREPNVSFVQILFMPRLQSKRFCSILITYFELGFPDKTALNGGTKKFSSFLYESILKKNKGRCIVNK